MKIQDPFHTARAKHAVMRHPNYPPLPPSLLYSHCHPLHQLLLHHPPVSDDSTLCAIRFTLRLGGQETKTKTKKSTPYTDGLGGNGMTHFASPPAIIPAFIRPHPPFEQPPLEHLLPVAFPPPTQHVPSSSRGHISPIIIQIALLSLILSPLELPASVESLLDSLVRLHHHHHHLALSADSSLGLFSVCLHQR